jgi:hypothetical protein
MKTVSMPNKCSFCQRSEFNDAVKTLIRSEVDKEKFICDRCIKIFRVMKDTDTSNNTIIKLQGD